MQILSIVSNYLLLVLPTSNNNLNHISLYSYVYVQMFMNRKPKLLRDEVHSLRMKE